MTDTRANSTSNPPVDPYLQAFKGSFIGVLRWPQLDDLWQVLLSRRDQPWYIYAIGEAAPSQPVDGEKLAAFVREIDTLLRTEHGEDYCGVVYADDLQAPRFIKIFDPNNQVLFQCDIAGFSWSVSVHGEARLAANGLSPLQEAERGHGR